MALSLYDASVANYLQILGAVSGVLDKSLAHFREKGIDPETIVEARLAPDMQPLRFQIISVAQHSRGAIEGVREGVFTRRRPRPHTTSQGYRGSSRRRARPCRRGPRRRSTRSAATTSCSRSATANCRSRPRAFLMSFSLPNFYFHATTAYDILRTNGVPLGKRDFMGRLNMKA